MFQSRLVNNCVVAAIKQAFDLPKKPHFFARFLQAIFKALVVCRAYIGKYAVMRLYNILQPLHFVGK